MFQNVIVTNIFRGCSNRIQRRKYDTPKSLPCIHNGSTAGQHGHETANVIMPCNYSKRWCPCNKLTKTITRFCKVTYIKYFV